MLARKLLTLTGAAVVAVVAVVVVISGNTPGADASGSTVAAYYHDHNAKAVVAAFLIGLTAPLLVAFATRFADGRRSASELVFVAGSAVLAATFLLTAAVQFALADVPDKLSGGALQALNVLSNDLWAAWNPAIGVMMLGAAATLRRRDTSLHVLGTIAAVIGVASFIPFADFFALLATGLWLIGASVVLYRRTAEPRYAAQPQVA
jgi:hypothetical protein